MNSTKTSTIGTSLTSSDHARAREAAMELRNHPYSYLSLSDREKFHTGFLAVAINRLGTDFANDFFGDLELPDNAVIYAETEHRSADLIIRTNAPDGNIHAIVEVKFKSRVNVPQLAKYMEAFSNVHKRFVVGIFSSVSPAALEAHGFVFCPLTTSTIKALGPRIDAMKADFQHLFALWLKYLESIEILRQYFEAAGNQAIDPAIPQLLYEAKLKSVFASMRLATVATTLQAGLATYPAINHLNVVYDNWHGEPLIHYDILRGNNAGLGYGLQWQGPLLKFFIETARSDKDRDRMLIDIATELRSNDVCAPICQSLQQNTNKPPRLNKDGRFRSITLAEWDVFGDIGGRAVELLTLLNTLAGYRDRVAMLRPS